MDSVSLGVARNRDHKQCPILQARFEWPENCDYANEDQNASALWFALNGADLNAGIDDAGQSALVLAVERGDVVSVRVLLEAGARTDDRDIGGETTLYGALTGPGGSFCVKLLLNAGANPDAQSHGGMTPLHWAAAMGMETEVRMLLKAGARTDIRDMNGKTARDESSSPSIRHLLENSETQWTL